MIQILFAFILLANSQLVALQGNNYYNTSLCHFNTTTVSCTSETTIDWPNFLVSAYSYYEDRNNSLLVVTGQVILGSRIFVLGLDGTVYHNYTISGRTYYGAIDNDGTPFGLSRGILRYLNGTLIYNFTQITEGTNIAAFYSNHFFIQTSFTGQRNISHLDIVTKQVDNTPITHDAIGIYYNPEYRNLYYTALVNNQYVLYDGDNEEIAIVYNEPLNTCNWSVDYEYLYCTTFGPRRLRLRTLISIHLETGTRRIYHLNFPIMNMYYVL